MPINGVDYARPRELKKKRKTEVREWKPQKIVKSFLKNTDEVYISTHLHMCKDLVTEIQKRLNSVLRFPRAVCTFQLLFCLLGEKIHTYQQR